MTALGGMIGPRARPGPAKNGAAPAKTAGDTAQKTAEQEPAPAKAAPNPMPVALELGWTMAVLYGQTSASSDLPQDRLPTEHELAPVPRIGLDVARANTLLDRLATMLPKSAGHEATTPEVTGLTQPQNGHPAPGAGAAADVAAAGGDAMTQFRTGLEASNLGILTWLAAAGREVELAYQLGRSLRDTANPPLRSDPGQAADKSRQIYDAVWYQLSRGRVAKLQEWLATLSKPLPDDSAAIVSASIGRWGDLASTIFDPATPGRLRGAPRRPGHASKKTPRGHAGPPEPPGPDTGGGNYPSEQDVAGELYRSLLPQGDAWLNLLTGAEDSSGLLTPEGYVAAGEAALGRSARIIKRIVVHYWFPLLLLAGAVAAALFFAARDVGGAGKVWTQIATVGSALGITAKGIGNRMATLTKDAGESVFTAEENDAKAWAITCIPANLKLTGPGVRALRRSGIRRAVPLGRV